MNTHQPKSYALLLLVFYYLVGTCAIGQKKITKLTDYAGSDYWIVQKKGLKGLKSGKGKQIVPALYDLVLPSIQSEFSFIAKNGKLGIYDNLKQKELVLEGDYDKVSLFIDIDNQLVLKFTNPYSYNNTESGYVLKRDSNNDIFLHKEEKYVYHETMHPFEENGLEKADSMNFIHHFSSLVVFQNTDKIEEEIMNVNLNESFQKTGVYSLSINKFTVPPEYVSIERLFEMDDYESTFFYDFYIVSQLDLAIFDKTVKTYQPIRELRDLYKTGLYSTTFKLLVAPQHKSILPLGNDWFYIPTTNDSITVYDNKGNLTLQLSNIPEDAVFLQHIGRKYYLATETDDDWDVNMEMRTEFYNYHIYDENGNYIKSDKFSIDYSTYKKNISIVLVQKQDNEWEFLYGAYDFEKSEFVIPPVFSSIDKRFFREDIITCTTGNCSYYFELEKEESYSYLDQNLEPFTPTSAISKDIFERIYHRFNPEYLTYYTQITPVFEGNRIYKVFEEEGIVITHEIYEDELMLLDGYAGYVFAEFGKFQIMAMYEIYDFEHQEEEQNPSYGLIDKKRSRLLLPPFFSKMEFNKESNKLEFTYEGESGSILLERYE